MTAWALALIGAGGQTENVSNQCCTNQVNSFIGLQQMPTNGMKCSELGLQLFKSGSIVKLLEGLSTGMTSSFTLALSYCGLKGRPTWPMRVLLLH